MTGKKGVEFRFDEGRGVTVDEVTPAAPNNVRVKMSNYGSFPTPEQLLWDIPDRRGASAHSWTVDRVTEGGLERTLYPSVQLNLSPNRRYVFDVVAHGVFASKPTRLEYTWELEGPSDSMTTQAAWTASESTLAISIAPVLDSLGNPVSGSSSYSLFVKKTEDGGWEPRVNGDMIITDGVAETSMNFWSAAEYFYMPAGVMLATPAVVDGAKGNDAQLFHLDIVSTEGTPLPTGASED